MLHHMQMVHTSMLQLQQKNISNMPTLFPKENNFFASENRNVPIFWRFKSQKSGQFWLNRDAWQVWHWLPYRGQFLC